MSFSTAQPLPHSLTELPQSSPASSPKKRTVTAGTTAVIRSPMAITTQEYGAGSTFDPNAALLSRGRGMPENVSPLSTTTATDYAEIEQKQVELRSIVEHRITSLESLLRQRESELEALRMQLAKTEEDYQFNYDLIRDRDAALEEAATQLQSMYDELKRCKAEEVTTAKRLQGLELETYQLRQRLREMEEQREQTVQRLQEAHQFKDMQLKERVSQKEIELDNEKQRLHEEYLRRFKSLDDIQVEVKEKNELLLAELEKKWSQQVKRLEEKLSSSATMMENIQREKATCESRCTDLLQALSLMKQEHEAQQQKHQAAMAETAEKQRELETKLGECSAIMGRGIATAEDSIRQQTRRATMLEVECGQLQQQVTELQERLQATRLQHDEDIERFTKENHDIQERYQQAAAQAEEHCRLRSDTERELTFKLQRLQSELDSTREKCEIASSRVSEWQSRYEGSERERAQCEQELERLRREIQRCHEEEQRTAAHAQETRRVADEKIRSASVKAEAAQDEVERLKKRLLDAQERTQTEEARLTRELHASEAARRALEEHFHLLDNNNGQRALIEGLRSDKELLERRVVEMERTNAAIREQVASFTMELQNDPAIKSAKETQRRVQELQEELLQARDDVQRLRDVVREKEEELSQCKLEVLQAQSENMSMLRHSEKHRNMKEAYERLRHSLKGLHQQQQHEKKRRSSSRNRGQRVDDTDCDENTDTRDNQQCDSKKIYNAIERNKALIKDSEFWRRKSIQLEQNLRDLILERDRLTRELHLTHHDVSALTSEKQLLLDLNSLLKAQLRDAYRTAIEYPKQASTPQLAADKEQQQYNSSGASQQAHLAMAASHSEVRESNQSMPFLAVDGVIRRSTAQQSSVDAKRLAALEEELAAMKAHMLTQYQGVNSATCADKDNNNPVSLETSLRVPLRPRQGQQQQKRKQERAVTSRAVNHSRAPVVQKGSSVVRHYGYS